MIASETVDAGKVKFGATEALELARSASKVIVARGRSYVEFDMKKDRPDDGALRKVLLGPTGTLRAPAIRQGRTLVVGFHPEVYAEYFG